MHYLASVVFCDDFERRCSTVSAQGVEANVSTGDGAATGTKLLQKEVEATFGSLQALQERVQELSSGTMSAGRLWIVYSPHSAGSKAGGVNVLSLPGSKVPLAHGLWPLAVINLSEERVCEELERRTASVRSHDSGVARADVPPWSHAARTHTARRLALGQDEKSLNNDPVEQMNLFELQKAVAERALDTMNWSFVEEQLASALAYYNSAERTSKRQEHRKEKEQLAAVRAMSRLKDSGAVIHAADTVTISSPHSPGAIGEVEAASAPLSDGSPKDSASTAAAAAVDAGIGASDAGLQKALEGASADVAASSQADASAGNKKDVAKASSHDGETAPASASSGPAPVQLPDGTWEYRYENGDVTRLRKDGTKIFQTKELTTTVFVNGDTLFEYPNSTSILDRADGVRITTYADGTKKEERLR